MRTFAFGIAGLGMLVGSMIACGGGGDGKGAATTNAGNEVIGGVAASSAALNAIGSLVHKDAQTGTTELLCTATLIAPRIVLTAKHCALDKFAQQDEAGTVTVVESRLIDALQISFAIGPDSRAPVRVVQAESVETCNVANTGYMGLGCDVAIYRLKESIDDVRPLKVAKSSVGEDAIGKRMSAVGYGNQVSIGTVNGTRKAGTLTMRAVRGAPMQVLFPESVEAFLDAMREAEGEAYVDNNGAVLRDYYNLSLLDGYEVYAGAVEGDAQVCHGDSGGPLLAKVDGELVVQGVASGVVSGPRLPCKFGAAYATFGPKAQELIARSLTDPCDGIPAEGRCEGDVATRCTTATEGPRRVTRTDCSLLLQRCIAPAAAPAPGADADAGTPDADATATASDAGAPSVECGD